MILMDLFPPQELFTSVSTVVLMSSGNRNCSCSTHTHGGGHSSLRKLVRQVWCDLVPDGWASSCHLCWNLWRLSLNFAKSIWIEEKGTAWLHQQLLNNHSKCFELPSGSTSLFPFGFWRTKALTSGTLMHNQVNGLIQSLK